MAGYIPPSLRKKQQDESQEEKPLPTPSTQSFEEAFPTLGSSSSKTATIPQVDTFKQKIQQLIALEQRTEEEKRIAEEQERINRGTTFLSLRLQSTFATQFNDRLAEEETFNTSLAKEFEYGTLPTQYDMPKEMLVELLMERKMNSPQ
jgi:hypothetical protein